MGIAQRERRDIYYKIAKLMGYRSRSALKLLQVDEKFHILDDFQHAVDLCASPGGFSQVLLEKVRPSAQGDAGCANILGIDVQPIHPIDGIEFWERDITDSSLYNDILNRFSGVPLDIVVCDGAPDSLGTAFEDGYYQGDLVLNALCLAIGILKTGGTFVAKVFRGKYSLLLSYRVSQFFATVEFAKPRTCRQSSCEAYLVCLDFKMPQTLADVPLKDLHNYFWPFVNAISEAPSDFRVPFVGCGSLPYDADANYPLLPDDCEFTRSCASATAPIQLPIAPAYKVACEMKREHKLVKPR